ncbi:hypothetical protein FGM00_18995 [Aggregatimonas sangjinii]|uniref:Uncharacterized protein n=1 Tax=Aggregatimonas sangjinii TaxID=2583587 RepID=A0A5B7SXT7_9FLAO|nr:hypothetical protein [Aggregatimonas sangjinii]QCX02099.1 hypothetical protein FGM00_18995 [Aggregatimonas sangjinii]
MDNKFGKRLSILLLPIYVIIILLSSLEYNNSNYLKVERDSSEFYSANNHYENLSEKEDTFISVAAIPSKVIETDYLKVFLLYSEEMEDFIFEMDEKLKPKEDKRTFYSKFFSEFKRGMDIASGKKEANDIANYLKITNQLYHLKIDSTDFESNFVVATNSKERIGFETYLNIKDLEAGKKVLIIEGPVKSDSFEPESETTTKILVTIPFWYFPQNISPILLSKKIEMDTAVNKQALP